MTGVVLINPPIHRDTRGSFQEVYNRTSLGALLEEPPTFIQDNLSRSGPWVLRGLHYQHPTAQGKLLSCIRGAIFDVVVDLREGSPTFHQWRSFMLDAQGGQQLWVPEGMAHGFLALRDGADVLYKVTAPYRPEEEGTIRWDDPTLDIAWPLPEDRAPRLSPKDARGLGLDAAPVF